MKNEDLSPQEQEGLEIFDAIVHIDDHRTKTFLLSSQTLNLDDTFLFDYIKRHLRRCIKDTRTFSGSFPSTHALHLAQQEDVRLLGLSQELSKSLSTHFKDEVGTCINLLWVSYRYETFPYVACLFLNTSPTIESYIAQDDKPYASFTLSYRSLPLQSKPLETFFLIDVVHGVVRYKDDMAWGSTSLKDWLAIPVMQSEEMVLDKVVSLVKEAAKQEPKAMRAIKQEIQKAHHEDQPIEMAVFLEQAFKKDETKRWLKNELEAQHIPSHIELPKRNLRPSEVKQRLKLDNGVELVVPVELFDDVSAIEFSKDDSGNTTILLKNIRHIENKG